MIAYKALAINGPRDDFIPVYLLIVRYILQSVRILVAIRLYSLFLALSTQENIRFIQNNDITFPANDPPPSSINV